MQHFIILKENLIQKALSLKKYNSDSVQVFLTEDQVDKYISLVKNEITKLQQNTQNFTFEIRSSGTPVKYSPVTAEILEIIKEVRIYHNKATRTYSTSNTSKQLNHAYSSFIPVGLKACLEPVGHREALNIPKPPKKYSRRYKKAAGQVDLALASNENENTTQNEELEV